MTLARANFVFIFLIFVIGVSSNVNDDQITKALREVNSILTDQIKKLEGQSREIKVSPRPPRPVITTGCTVVRALYDSKGNFLKFVCDDRVVMTLNDAELHCHKNGMDMLIIENEDVYKAFTNFMAEHDRGIWGDQSGIWLNGRKFGDEWFVYRNFEKEPLPSVSFYTNSTVYSGNCLMLKRIGNGPYTGRPHSCMEKKWVLCEFKSFF